MRGTFTTRPLSLAIASLCLGGLAAGAHAQGSGLVLEEVIVSATKQEQNLNDVGVSVVALSSRQIEDMGLRSMGDLVKSVPNVDITANPNGTKLTIRGVGSAGTNGVSPSVATFTDGVYLSSSRSTNPILFDMQRVEVLRGPQGALFGKNSIAGVFNLLTARPTNQFEGLVDVRAGNFDSYEGTLVLSGGITDDIAARFAAFRRHTGNYLENDLGGPDAGGTDQEAYRLNVTWNIGENTDLWFKYEHNHDKLNAQLNQLISLDPGDAAILDGLQPGLSSLLDTKLDRHMASSIRSRTGYDLSRLDDKRTNTSDRDLVALELTHTFANDYEFSALAGYDHNDWWVHGNASSAYPLMNIYIDSNNKFESKSLELKLASPTDGRFHYTVGVYGEENEDTINKGLAWINFDLLGPVFNGLMVTPPPFGVGLPPGTPLPSATDLTPAMIFSTPSKAGATEVTSWAVFFEGTYEFNDEWSLTAGVRYAEDKIDQTGFYSHRTDFNGNPFTSPQSFAAAIPPALLAGNPALPFIYSGLANSIFSTFANTPSSPDFDQTHKDRAVLPSAKLEFRPDGYTLYYFSAQTGYKNGGFSTANLASPTPFDKETSLAFELGGKFTLADGRGQLNVAIFHTAFDDLQVAVVDPISGAVGFTNAAEAVSKGFEIGTQWLLTEGLTLGVNYGYLDAKYDSFPGATCNIDAQLAQQAITDANPAAQLPPCVQDLGGEPLNNAPKNTGSVSLDFVQPLWGSLQFQSNLMVSYTDSFYVEATNSHQLEADSATLVNLRLALADTVNRWTVALTGQNLTDDDGLIYGAGSGLGHRKGTTFGMMRQPRTYWVQLEKRF